MSRIQLSQPSFANGFARSRRESVRPDLWPDHAWVPALGCQGNYVFDLCGTLHMIPVNPITWIPGAIATSDAINSQLSAAANNSNAGPYGYDNFCIVADLYSQSSGSLDTFFGWNSYHPQFIHSYQGNFGWYDTGGAVLFDGTFPINNRYKIAYNRRSTGSDGFDLYVNSNIDSRKTYDKSLGQGTISALRLGWSGAASEHFTGNIYAVLLYAKALSAIEIALLHNDMFLPFRRRLPVFYSVPSTGGGTTYQGEAIDGVTIGESTASRGIFGATAIDGIGIGEGQSGLLKALLSVSDGIKISELSAGRLSISANGVDGIALSDAASAIAVLGALASDGVSISDTGAGDLGGLIAEALDGFKIGDTASSIAALIANAIDGAAIGDSALSIASMISVAIDGILLSDNAISGSFEGLAADGFKLTDSSITILKILQSIADGIAMGDAASTRVDFTITCADGVTFGETIGTIMTMLATASDTFNLGDIAVYLDQQIATITLSTRSPSITFTLRKPTITFN